MLIPVSQRSAQRAPQPSGGRRAVPVGLVGALVLWSGCGPSLSDRPTDFQGDGQVEVAVLCGDETVGATQSKAAWIKTTVRAEQGVEVDWPGVTLVTRGVKVVRRAAGRVVAGGGGKSQRTITYWAVSSVGAGTDGVELGPIEVRYRTSTGALKVYTRGACPLTVVE